MDANKIESEIFKLIAETSRINTQAKWYPFVVLTGVFGAAIVLVKFGFH